MYRGFKKLRIKIEDISVFRQICFADFAYIVSTAVSRYVCVCVCVDVCYQFL